MATALPGTNIQLEDVVGILYNRYQGAPTIVPDGSIGLQGSLGLSNPDIFASSSLLLQLTPDSFTLGTPQTISGVTRTPLSNYPYIVKYENITVNGSSSNYISYYDKIGFNNNGVNLLSHTIPSNYAKSGAYQATIYVNGTPTPSYSGTPGTSLGWNLDNATGLLTFYNTPPFNSNDVIKVTVYRYEGTIGFGSNVQINDTSSNVLTVIGGISCSNLYQTGSNVIIQTGTGTNILKNTNFGSNVVINVTSSNVLTVIGGILCSNLTQTGSNVIIQTGTGTNSMKNITQVDNNLIQSGTGIITQSDTGINILKNTNFGSNVVINVTSSNVLTVIGGISCSNLYQTGSNVIIQTGTGTNILKNTNFGSNVVINVTSSNVLTVIGGILCSNLTQTGSNVIIQTGTGTNSMKNITQIINTNLTQSGTGIITQTGTGINYMKDITQVDNNLIQSGTGIITQSDTGINILKNTNFGSNVFINVTSSNVLSVTGNISCSNYFGNGTLLNGYSNTTTGSAISVGTSPHQITAGYGYIWVTNKNSPGTVKVINPSGTPAVLTTITSGIGNQPSAITAGYGYIWVTNYTSPGTVKVIDPSTRSVVNTIPVGNVPGAITTGYGYIWVTNNSGNSVSVIDPVTKLTVGTAIPVGNGPNGITAGYGYIWVINGTISGTVSVINPSTRAVVNTISVGSYPSAITAAYGYIWVVNTTIPGTLKVINPIGPTVETFFFGNSAFEITAGYGYIWVTTDTFPSIINIIEPSTRAVVNTITNDNISGGITTGYGYIWVINFTDNSVSVIQGQGILTSSDVTTGTLEVTNKTTMNGDLELVNSSLRVTGNGTITCAGIEIGSNIHTNDTSSNVLTVTGNISCSNMTIGSNIHTNDTSSNVLSVTGNISCSNYFGNGSYLTGLTGTTPNLQQVTTVGNTASNIILNGYSTTTTGSPIPVGTQPTGITAGYGYIWVTNNTSPGTVKVINPSTKALVTTITSGIGNNPRSITVGYGYIWVANTGGTVSVIDPSTKAVVGTAITVGNQPTGITAGYGSIWVTNTGGSFPTGGTTVSVIDPSTKAVTTISGFTGPRGITAGYGYIWVTNSGGTTVSVIDPSTKLVVTGAGLPIPVGNNPFDITAGYGYIWVTNFSDNSVSVINPSGTTPTVVSAITSGIGTQPNGITAGYGYIWVANHSDDTVSVIDPSTKEVVGTAITVGNGPIGITAGYGYIWVTNNIGDNSVSVIQGKGILTSSDVTTGTLEVTNKTTMNGDLELVNSSLSLTGPGTITCSSINTTRAYITQQIISTYKYSLLNIPTPTENGLKIRILGYFAPGASNSGYNQIRMHLIQNGTAITLSNSYGAYRYSLNFGEQNLQQSVYIGQGTFQYSTYNGANIEINGVWYVVIPIEIQINKTWNGYEFQTNSCNWSGGGSSLSPIQILNSGNILCTPGGVLQLGFFSNTFYTTDYIFLADQQGITSYCLITTL